MRHPKSRPNVELVATFPEDPTPVPLLHCIVCDRSFESAVPEGMSQNQPFGGTTFTAEGQYGSTAFDPLDGSYLEVTICDPCLEAKATKQRVLIGRARRPVVMARMGIVGWESVEGTQRFWDPNTSAYDEDERNITLTDLDNLPKSVQLNIPIEDIKKHLEP